VRIFAMRAPGMTWRAIVPRLSALVVFGLAGLLFWISADTSHGTNLRSDAQMLKLSDVVRDQGRRNETAQHDLSKLQRDVDSLVQEQANDPQARSRIDAVADPAGVTPVSGEGLTVTLTDAPPDATSRVPGVRQPTADDLVVHQQDIQGVVNALWAGGARAIQIMDQRIVATSAVRCVGNTLILHGRVYSPPYVVSAVGDTGALRRALDESESVFNYTTYVEAFGLGWKVEDKKRLDTPGYTGPLGLEYAKVSGT
jgi:uncharacterized protein YlxW (UPF0749 family)